ncbi:MAG: peptidoglycan DD-metalloendopeptidase family protein [Methylococcaceae bacterium]
MALTSLNASAKAGYYVPVKISNNQFVNDKHPKNTAKKDIPPTKSITSVTHKSNSTHRHTHKKESAKRHVSQKKDRKNSQSSASIEHEKISGLNFGWPITGKVLKKFSPSRNKGIDIAGKQGQLIKATEAGKVVYDGQGLIGFGKLLIIKHNAIYLSAYTNNSRLLVNEGESVAKGQAIAKVGDVGIKRTSLHFEIRKNGKPINPLKLLPKK